MDLDNNHLDELLESHLQKEQKVLTKYTIQQRITDILQ
mgnify:CR=1 FL=1